MPRHDVICGKAAIFRIEAGYFGVIILPYSNFSVILHEIVDN